MEAVKAFLLYNVARVDARGSQVMKAWGVGLLALLLGGTACKKKAEDVTEAAQAGVPQAHEQEWVQLWISGFNYTDLYIENFSVAGVGGGNVYVSSPASGGGGSTCCLRWVAGLTQPLPVKVAWTRDRKQVCEKEVMISEPIPLHPQYIAVHFFQDGHIEVELAEDLPPVKLQLERFSSNQRNPSGNTVGDARIARCHDAFSP